MPDFSQFVKFFNTALPAPTTNGASVLAAGGTGGADGHSAATSTTTTAHAETVAHTRLADATWRLLVASDAAAKDGGKGNAASAANIITGGGGAGGGSASPTAALGIALPSITVGRMAVTTEDRWRIQAAMRREEVKSGQTRKEYNKKVTRAIKVTKGPSGEGFPAGRGRPL